MDQLTSLIESLPGWQNLTPQAIYAKLSQKDIPFKDDRKWTWQGIALVMIPETVER